MTAPRYPLTAIPLNTPKPKSIAISAYVDEALRNIIVDYAEKLSVKVDPMGGAEWDVAANTNLPWYASENVATATAMREYLARLLYFGDEGLVENLQADEAKINKELDEVETDFRREEAEQPISFPNEVSPPLAPNTAPLEAVEGFADKAHAKVCASTDRPTRIILRSYAADDKPRIERLLGLARQLQIPVQLAGSWSCTAFPKGEEAHPALDVVFPEVLVHPRDLLICEGDEKRLFVPSLTEAENQLLWAAREEDQRFVTSLIELLGLHAEADLGDIMAAVETNAVKSHHLTECHRQRARYEECDAQVRDILGAAKGEESVDAAKRVIAELVEWKRGQASWKNDAIALRTETAENQRKLLDILNAGTVYTDWKHCLDYTEARMTNARKFKEDVNAALGFHPAQSPHSALQRAKWLKEQDKYQTEKLAEALGYKSDDFSALLEQVQRVIREHQTLLGERIESNAKIDRLCASLDKVVPERDTLKAQVEGFVVELATARAEIAELRATRSACGYCSTHLERVEKERDTLKEQLNAIHVRMLDILGPDAGINWSGVFDSVEKAVKAEANNKELEVKLSQANLTLERLRATLSATEKDRDDAKERLETAITAERQTIAQRIDLALTGNAVATHLDTMLRAVGNSRRDTKILQNLISQIADALDAPSEEKAFTNDDGSLNTALVDRIVGYYKRLYTAAGYSEPPQGGWEELPFRPALCASYAHPQIHGGLNRKLP